MNINANYPDLDEPNFDYQNRKCDLVAVGDRDYSHE